MPFEDNSFDIIVSSDVIEHLDNVEQYLNEMERVVKEQGHIIISTPIRISFNPLDIEHKVEWFEEEYQTLIGRRYPQTTFYRSHPLFFLEILNKFRFRFLFSMLSIFYNPFSGFDSSYFKYYTLQYSVSKNTED